MDIKRQTKHIRGLAKTLITLADEVDEQGKFENADLELLKKIGCDILFKGVSIGYLEVK